MGRSWGRSWGDHGEIMGEIVGSRRATARLSRRARRGGKRASGLPSRSRPRPTAGPATGRGRGASGGGRGGGGGCGSRRRARHERQAQRAQTRGSGDGRLRTLAFATTALKISPRSSKESEAATRADVSASPPTPRQSTHTARKPLRANSSRLCLMNAQCELFPNPGRSSTTPIGRGGAAAHVSRTVPPSASLNSSVDSAVDRGGRLTPTAIVERLPSSSTSFGCFGRAAISRTTSAWSGPAITSSGSDVQASTYRRTASAAAAAPTRAAAERA